MRKRWLTLAVFVAAAIVTAHPQDDGNLVHNPSFESHRRCPERIDALGVMSEADAWWQPTAGSSDYFNACGSRECAVPRNKMGVQQAHSGEAYCGIYCSQENYREYLQTELKSPLERGRRYRVSFWVSLAEKSPHATSAIGAALTAERLADTSHGILTTHESIDLDDDNTQTIATDITPQIANDPHRALDNCKEWVEIHGEYTAQGGERYLTIGNFLPFNKSGIVATNRGNTPLPGAYYYVDDVEVRCLDQSATVPATPIDVPPPDSVMTLHNVYFATGESEVLQQSYNELARLARMLSENPTLKIAIYGHTDNQGTQEYNQKLSEARARSVAEQLIGMGIDRRRISWQGFGKSRPVADNATAEGRGKNRRVEYKVTTQ